MPIIATDDRHAIEDLYAEYVWALDSGDVPAFLTLFAPDAVFGDTAGHIYKGHDAIGAYVRALTTSPPFRGRQHIISHLRFRPSNGNVGVKAYWLVTKWSKASGAKTVEVSGHSDDVFVHVGGQWRFAQRLVHYWNDIDLPWAGGAAS
jgi:uncharacterized protein (TIGR02246 family)